MCMEITEKSELLEEARKTLEQLLSDYKEKGLLSIYLWGSVTTPDFNSKTSDIDAIGILSDKANHLELLKIREWLPKANPKLVRLQINFFTKEI